jgi:hypothetical protein
MSPSDRTFKAVVNLSNDPREVQDLKLLALIFDEIYYIYPQLYCLEDVPKDKAIGLEFDLFRDCVVYDVITFDDLKEALSILGDTGIAKGIHARDEKLKDLRRNIALLDEKDPEFRKLVPASPGAAIPFSANASTAPGTARKLELVAVNPSMAIWDSLILTNTLFLANTESLFPVFLESRHRREMEYRYNQYRQQSSKIASMYPDLASPVNFGTQFGEVTFSIFNNVWSHQFLMHRSLEEIIRYRDNMAPARKKYIASLTELTGIAQENPWNQKTKDELKKYLLKLDADLETYRQQADRIGQKMFDDVKVHGTDAVLKGTAGAVGTGLSGILAPQIPIWVLILVGALGASSGAVTQICRSVLESRRAREVHKQSAIAYIAEF